MILGGHEADGIPYRMRAAGSADTVDVILRVHREVVVYHVRDVVHIDAAGGDVRGHQHAHRAGLEVFQGAQPLILRTVGM